MNIGLSFKRTDECFREKKVQNEKSFDKSRNVVGYTWI